MGGRRYDAVPVLVPFGLHIAGLRKKSKLSQEDLAEKSSLDRGYISGIENGKRNPSTIQLFKLAKGLGVEPKVLFDYPSVGEGVVDQEY